MSIINLEKGQRVTLEKKGGEPLSLFCIGVDWGAIDYETKEGGFWIFGRKTVTKKRFTDIDLSCVMYDEQGNLIDHVYSPLYRPELMAQFGLMSGKLTSNTGAIRHSGDDKEGDMNGEDGLDNEVLMVDLTAMEEKVTKVFLFLNIVDTDDFSMIPYTRIRIYEGEPRQVENVFAEYNIEPLPVFRSKKAMILGELYKKGTKWRFNPIGEAYEDVFLGQTIQRISQKFAI